MKIAIMQPYFFPYIGYFQLINTVDIFIVYDNIQFTKKSWINRNRFLMNGKPLLFSLPLKKDSDFLDVNKRVLSSQFSRTRLLNQIRAAYRGAPFFEQAYSIFEKAVMSDFPNLFSFIHNSIRIICSYLGVTSTIRVSSSLDVDHSLKAQEKVITICSHLCADTYVNAIGGVQLYSKEAFSSKNIELKFLQTEQYKYKQFDNAEFVPWLSIIDVIMFSSKEIVKEHLDNNYRLL